MFQKRLLADIANVVIALLLVVQKKMDSLQPRGRIQHKVDRIRVDAVDLDVRQTLACCPDMLDCFLVDSRELVVLKLRQSGVLLEEWRRMERPRRENRACDMFEFRCLKSPSRRCRRLSVESRCVSGM